MFSNPSGMYLLRTTNQTLFPYYARAFDGTLKSPRQRFDLVTKGLYSQIPVTEKADASSARPHTRKSSMPTVMARSISLKPMKPDDREEKFDEYKDVMIMTPRYERSVNSLSWPCDNSSLID